jgi:hypothetical protein
MGVSVRGEGARRREKSRPPLLFLNAKQNKMSPEMKNKNYRAIASAIFVFPKKPNSHSFPPPKTDF